MNEELISILRDEQNNIIPKGSIFLAARGSGKTYMQLARILRYNGYELYCQMAKHLNSEETLESAHKWINDYVVMMFPE